MKKLLCLLTCLFMAGASHASTALSGIATTNELLNADIVLATTDPGGTPRSKTITVSNLFVNRTISGQTNIGHILFSPDDTYNIGAVGANRPDAIYAGGSIVAGGNISGSTLIAVSSVYVGGGQTKMQAAAGSLTLTDISAIDFDSIKLGGTTVAYPGIQRYLAGIRITGADGSFNSTNNLIVPGALIVTNSFQLVDGTESANYVLTSDANGVGTWQAAAAAANAIADLDGLGTNTSFYSETTTDTPVTVIPIAGGTNAALMVTLTNGTPGFSVNSNLTEVFFPATNTWLHFNGKGAVNPAINAITADAGSIEFRLGDDSNYANILADNITADGNVTVGQNDGLVWATESVMLNLADGVIGIMNQAQNDFDRLVLGSAGTPNYPAIARTNNAVRFELGNAASVADIYTGNIFEHGWWTNYTDPSVISLAEPGQIVTVTDTNTYTFSNTNDRHRTTVILRNPDSKPVNWPTPAIGGFRWLTEAPTNTWSGTNTFWFYSVDGEVFGEFSGAIAINQVVTAATNLATGGTSLGWYVQNSSGVLEFKGIDYSYPIEVLSTSTNLTVGFADLSAANQLLVGSATTFGSSADLTFTMDDTNNYFKVGSDSGSIVTIRAKPTGSTNDVFGIYDQANARAFYGDSNGVFTVVNPMIFDSVTASRVAVFDAAKQLTNSTVTTTELGQLGGYTDQLYIPASYMISNTTASATFMTTNRFSPTNRVHDVYVFPNSGSNEVQFSMVLADNWDASTIKAKSYWESPIGSGGVAWGVAATALDDSDAQTADWGTEVVITDTQTTAQDILLSAASGAITIGNSPTAGDMISVRIRRLTGHASDTIAGDVFLHGVPFQYGRSGLGVTAW